MTRVGRRCVALAGSLALALVAVPVRSAVSAPPVTSGDLTHLVYTATDRLDASLVTPNASAVVPTDHIAIAVVTVEGGGVEVAVDGVVVPTSHIGERAVDTTAHTATYTYYSVPFHAGANDLALTGLGADGRRGSTRHYTLRGAGAPAAVSATVNGALIADGRSSATLGVVALDAAQLPAKRASVVRATVLSGSASLAAIADTKGTARAAEGGLDDRGSVQFRIVGGTTSGAVVIEVAAGDVRVRVATFVRPYLREHAFITGLVSGGLGATPGNQDGDGNLDDGGSRRARAAFFGSGEVASGTSLQIAYDTASRLTPSATVGPYTLNPTDRPYQTYGDASRRYDDALSQARLYARLEHDRDSYTYGRFTASIGGETSASSYTQILSGSKLELANGPDTLHLTAFSATNNVAYARETVPVTGLATLGQTLHGNIVVGSDTVTLVTTDRRTGAVVAQTPLVRNSDYTLDTTSGTLRFITIPLPFDPQGNPQVLVIQYQYAGAVTDAKTTGGKLTARIGATTARIGYVNDVGGSGNFALFEQGLAAPLPGGGWSITHASANGVAFGTNPGLASTGQSLRVAAAATIGTTRVQAGYDATSAGYQNPFGGFATAGLSEYNLAVSHAFGTRGEVSLAANGQHLATTTSAASQAQVLLKYKQRVGSRLDVLSGVGTTSVAGSGASTQAQLGAAYRIGEKSTLSVSRLQDVGGTGTPSQPAQTQAGLDLVVNAGTHLFVRETWLDAPQRAFDPAASTVAATQGGTRLLQFGVDRKVGPATALTTQYTIDHTANGTDFYATNGVRETLTLGNHLKGDAFYQTSRSLSSSATTGPLSYAAYGASLAYGVESFHATAAFQDRAGTNGGYALQLGAAGALTEDLSLAGSLDQSYQAIGFASTARAGLALRPHANDRGALLLEFDRTTSNVVSGAETTNTLSLEGAERPNGRLELGLRFAYKLDGDGFYAAHTMLADLRVDQRLGRRADLAVESRTLRTPGIGGATATSFAVESGWRLGSALRLATGYNVGGTVDPNLAVAPAQRGFYVTMTSVVSRIFGWGR